MGADVRTEGRHAVVRGVARLSGAPVRALDVRAGAALVLAGLPPTARPSSSSGTTSTAGYPDLAGTLPSSAPTSTGRLGVGGTRA